MSALTSIASPRRAVDGAVEPLDEDLVARRRGRSGGSRPGSRGPRRAPPRSGRSRSCRCRRRAGRSASGRRPGTGPRRAGARRRCRWRDVTGVEAIRSISASSAGSRSTSASPPNATIPATSSSCFAARRLAHVRERLLAPGRAHGVGQVDDEDDGQPVDRQDELEPGEREHERRRAAATRTSERRPPPPDAEPPPRRRGAARRRPRAGPAGAAARAGASKRDAHQAPLPAGRVPRRAAARRARRRRASVSRS